MAAAGQICRGTLYSSDRLTIARRSTILKHVLNNVVDPGLDLDRVFRALADPGRRRMLERLSQGPASVSELGKPLSMSLAAVLQHVQILETSGLVRSRKLGRTRTCSLNAEPPAVGRAVDLVRARAQGPRLRRRS